MEATIEQIKKVISKIPHIEGRVPYTYHHDYLRAHCTSYCKCSRADISKLNKGEYELYALCLCEIIDCSNPLIIALIEFTDGDRKIIRECLNFAKDRYQ